MQIDLQQKKYETVWKLLRSIKILNVYQINILNNTVLMHQISINIALSVFLSKFKKPSHLCPTRFSNVSYIKPTYKLNILFHSLFTHFVKLHCIFMTKGKINNLFCLEKSLTLKSSSLNDALITMAFASY